MLLHEEEIQALKKQREDLAAESIKFMDEFDRRRKMVHDAEGPFWKTLGFDGHDEARKAWYDAMNQLEELTAAQADLSLRREANFRALRALRQAQWGAEENGVLPA